MIVWRDGKQIKISGLVFDRELRQWRCPTEKCDAFCCKTGSLFADMPPPCTYLLENKQCWFHVKGGMGAKPYGCVQYPRSQADVDHMNRNAVGDFRCYLTVSEV